MGNLSPRPSAAFLGARASEDAPQIDASRLQISTQNAAKSTAPPLGPESPRTPKKSGHHKTASRLISNPAFVEASTGQLGETFTLLDTLKKRTRSPANLSSSSTVITRNEIKMLQSTLQRLCILQAGEQDVLELLRTTNPDAYDRIAHQWLAQEYTQLRRATPPHVGNTTRGELLRYSSKMVDKRESLRHANVADNKILEVAQLLETLDQWDFDLLSLLNRKMTSKPVVLIATMVIQAQRLDATLDLDYEQLTQFFSDVDDSYYDNAYHNKWHAADVTQGVHFFLIEVLKDIPLSVEHRFAAIVAAAVHDMGHLGVNNAFLVNTGHPLALEYNDISPLENMHCSRAFKLMTRQGRRITANMDRIQQKTFRAAMVSMIMETDNARHVQLLEKLSKLSMSGNFNTGDGAHHLVLLEVCLHAIDVSNAARPWNSYRRWTRRIVDEFYQQGDSERTVGIDVTSIFDRTKPIPLEKFQVGFMNAIVSPVYTTLQQVPQLHLSIPFDQLNKNIESWQKVIRGECTIDDLDRELGYTPEVEYVPPEENVALMLCNADSWDESYVESADEYSEYIGEDDDSTLASSRANSAAGMSSRSLRSRRGSGNGMLAVSPTDPRTLARARSPRFRSLVQSGAPPKPPGRRYSQPVFSATQPDVQPMPAEFSRRSSDLPAPGFRGNSG